MTNNPNNNNGATLEDCHSNFFALTDLCGIRWRRLISDTSTMGLPPHHGGGGGGGSGSGAGGSSGGPLDDPVLSSYAKCLAADILCVWRRLPSAKGNQPLTPHDPFQPTPPTPAQNLNQFMSNNPMHSMHMSQHNMMPPHLPPGMGGHLGGHLGGPPPYSSSGGGGGGGHPHLPPSSSNPHHPFSSQLSPMHSSSSVYNNNPPSAHNNPTLHGPKELWIFWYGEEPDLNNLVSTQLLKMEPDQGSWESGLSYECRTLLFKALHNLIEKCLLARDFVRLGRWFIQPCEDNQRIGLKNFPMQLSFSFAFFLHGESTVCMSVDVRQHPPIKRVGRQHLGTGHPLHSLPVILAPHGLAGTLTGVSYRINDAGTHKILEEWKQFYPVEAALKSPMYDTSPPSGSHSSPHSTNISQSQSGANGMVNSIPPVIEVIVGGVRMRYPACYVLVTDLDDPTKQSEGPSVFPPPILAASNSSEGAASGSPAKPHGGSMTFPKEIIGKIGGILPERVWQEAILCLTKSISESNTSSSSANSSNSTTTELSSSNSTQSCLGQWDFADPTKRTPCTCSKCKIKSRSSQGSSGSGSSTKSGTKVKKSTFHKRTTSQMAQVDNWASAWDSVNDSVSGSTNSQQTASKPGELQGQNNQSTNNNRIGPPPGTPHGGPPSFKTGPGSINTTGIGSEGPNASPMSVAASPLATPKSQPPSVSQQDPSMPTLSPQPVSDKPPAATPDNGAPKSVSSISNQVFSPLTSGFDGAKTESGEQGNGGVSSGAATENNASEPMTASSMKRFPNTCALLVRPSLPSKDYEVLLREEDLSQPSDTIYDYSLVDAWLYHPVKRLKCNDGTNKTTMYCWGLGMKKSADGYSGVGNGSHHGRHHLGKRSADPYEFDEENHQAPAVNMEGLKRKDGEDDKSPYCNDNTGSKGISANLFTNEGLQPSIRDLDNLFETSDTSSDETFQVPTPPGSNKPSGGMDDTNINSSSLVGGGGTKCRSGLGILRPEELSKMFPTPPSHEPNPMPDISSPGGLPPESSSLESNEVISTSGAPVCIRGVVGVGGRSQESSYSGLGSPPGEPLEVRLSLESSNNLMHHMRTKTTTGGSHHSQQHHQHQLRMHLQDWSFVFKPPTSYKVLGSSKYAPLPTLPSHQLPPLPLLPNLSTYKATWQFTPSELAQQQQQQQQQMNQSSIQPQHQQQSTSNNNLLRNQNVHSHPPVPPPLLPHHLHHHQQQQQMCVVPSNIPNAMHLRPGLSPISPVPTSLRNAPFDMGSPTTNNMYLKQGPHGPQVISHPPHHMQAQQAPHGPSSHPGHGGGHHHMYGNRGVEAHALVVNLSLSDSVINLFRDHNFDSCTMCVCNASNKVIGNIRGSEVGLYIHDSSPEEESVRCNCGFSASANRRLAHRSGMFYEDEYEITTPQLAPLAMPNDEWYERKKGSFLLLDSKYPNASALLADKDANSIATIVDTIPPFLLEMLREQCFMLFGGINTASRFTGEISNRRNLDYSVNMLECVDANRAALTALEHGRTVMLEASGRSGFPRLPEDTMPLKLSLNLMHKWSFIVASGPKSSQDVMLVMRALLPLLQEAVHVKAWDAQVAQYTVSGPLTWRQFHRLAGRGTEDRCEPQPIPSILVGAEKDWIALSPLAIKFWEKLLLEPYAYPRDITYLVVAPDNEAVLSKVRTFFREFSSMYEVCQLGRHCAYTKVLRDGILKVGKNAATRLANEPVDEWFRSLPDHPASAALKLYAQVCRHYLAPQLCQVTLDQSLFDNSHQKAQERHNNPSPKMPPPTIDVTGNTQGPPTPKSESVDAENPTRELPTQEPQDDDDRDLPAMVIYLIDPFSFSSDNEDLHRLGKIGLLRCYNSILSYLPEQLRNNITLQVISLEDIMNLGTSTLETRLKNDQMRAMALSVYSQCRRLLVHQNNVKSLTGFGPAAAADLFLKSKDEKSKQGYKLYLPPYVLAPAKERLVEGSEWLNTVQGHTTGGLVSSGNSLTVGSTATPSFSSVLYVAYCISEDQRWLLASVTDDRGEILDTTTISIYVPNRSKRRKPNARKHGLQKLMDYILGIMSNGVSPWRLVVGRLGRIGHGELESWSSLLSKKSLLRASNQLKLLCAQCSLQYPTESPCVLSACLVSLEPDSCLRLMPDKFTPDERFSSSGTSAGLSTPQDISCTHILVFPTSATTQSSQTAFQEQHINGPELGDDSDLLFMVNDVDDGIDGMNVSDLQLGDIFNWPDTGAGNPSPVGSPRRDSTSQPGSPGGIGTGRQSPFQSGGQGRMGGRGDGGDEVGTLLQQPLALGYMVSTAPSGQLPSWFWASCPQRANEKDNGVFLKSALHLHSHSVFHNVDDLLQQQSNAKQHPLDSQFTTDVLRFVLEGYNALSWLALDPKTHDRKSCLPIHIQQLLHLYYTMSTLV